MWVDKVGSASKCYVCDHSKACRTCGNFCERFSAILDIEFVLVAKVSR